MGTQNTDVLVWSGRCKQLSHTLLKEWPFQKHYLALCCSSSPNPSRSFLVLRKQLQLFFPFLPVSCGSQRQSPTGLPSYSCACVPTPSSFRTSPDCLPEHKVDCFQVFSALSVPIADTKSQACPSCTLFPFV